MLFIYITVAIFAALLIAAHVAYRRLGEEVSRYYRNPSFALRLKYVKNGWKKPETIPQVVIDKDGGHKYVVLKFRGRIFIRADKSHGYHAGIVSAFMFEVGSRKVECLGGGRIDVQSARKRVYVDGTSQGYGMDQDRERTKLLIEEATGYDAGSSKTARANAA